MGPTTLPTHPHSVNPLVLFLLVYVFGTPYRLSMVLCVMIFRGFPKGQKDRVSSRMKDGDKIVEKSPMVDPVVTDGKSSVVCTKVDEYKNNLRLTQ